MPRSRSPRRSPFPGLLLFLCGIVVGAGGFYFGCRDSGRGAGERSATAASEPQRPPAPRRRHGGSPGPHDAGQEIRSSGERAAARTHGERAADAPVPEGVRLAVVIDDLGRSVDEVESLERLDVPLTYSVLPFEVATPEVVAALRRRGSEILCHLPMEAVNGENPGPGALRAGMDAGELRDATAAALAAVPGAVGVNNHMGSRLSASERSMQAVLGVLAGRNLFFLDSRTSPESVGYRVATALGMPAAERQVFLDGDPRPQMIREQFERMLRIARERGSAIAIGHPHPATLATLAAEVPKAKAEGYRFVPVSELLARRPAAP